MGCLPRMPEGFPIDTPENSGNMVHAMAPLLMFPSSVHSGDPHFKISGEKSFRPFVNNTSTHLIVTMANTLVLGGTDGAKYSRFQRALEQYTKPVVVFGLGVQSKGYDLDSASLPKEAIELVQYLSSRAVLLGVRGEYTKQVLEKLTGVRNIFVTGCPSLYSRPDMLVKLRENLRDDSRMGRAVVNVTNLNRSSERELLARALAEKHFQIEPVSSQMHQSHLNILRGESDATLPKQYSKILEISDTKISRDTLVEHLRTYYRLFRDVESWKQFNQENVSYTYGTRFHVNMQSILSGVPALWLTHDSRTRELVEFASLPSLDLESASRMTSEEIYNSIEYGPFFENISKLFARFNFYLSENGLPTLKHSF